jgi:hypothetical protein
MATAPDRGKAQTLQVTQYGQREGVFKRDIADRTPRLAPLREIGHRRTTTPRCSPMPQADRKIVIALQ